LVSVSVNQDGQVLCGSGQRFYPDVDSDSDSMDESGPRPVSRVNLWNLHVDSKEMDYSQHHIISID
jgi:hypothetical protein